MSDDDLDNIDISSLMRSYDNKSNRSLRELYEFKLKELNVTQTQALEVMDIEIRALNLVLDGSGSRVDLFTLIKLSKFLDIEQGEVIKLYLNNLKKTNIDKIKELDKRKFILQNFDVTQLKKEGIIESTSDFDEIEKTLVALFNYKSIFDYRKDVVNPAYSSSKLFKDNPNVDYWVEFSRQVFKEIHNPNEYDRKALINYFPTIRWHSMNVKRGLWEVIKSLHKMGITVIYLPKFKKLHIRGATFAVNNKPCIVLTDYRGYYPTLWFSLLHELHHVLFDWEDILITSFHLSDKVDLYTEVEVEEVANKFARDYLFSEDKMDELLPHFDDFSYVKEYSKMNHVHYSIPYIFKAYDKGNRGQWAWIDKYMPKINECLEPVENISLKRAVDKIADHYNQYIY